MGAIIKDEGCSLRFRDVGRTFSVLNDRYIPSIHFVFLG